MNSYQNLVLLQNLYRLKHLGFDYIDPIVVNQQTDEQLPSSLDALHHMIQNCHLCDLSKSRCQSMSGWGNPNADLMFVDTMVSMAEDESNQYYVGRSGDSLLKMVENVLMLDRDSVYYTHAVKCKPLGTNRPSASEWNSCKPYLFKQIELIQPKIIVTLGPDAYKLLSGDETDFDQVRGHAINFGSYRIIPLYHPQYLLRNPSLKRETLNDLHLIKSML